MSYNTVLEDTIMKNTKLNITFLDFDDIKNPLLNAGQARATLEVGSRLAKKGHTVQVISSKYQQYKDRMENGLYYRHIGISTPNIRLNNLIYIFSLPFVVPSIKTDVFLECFTAPISTLFSPLWTKIPVVAIPTSFEADRFSKLYKLPFNLVEKVGLKIYKYALPYTDIFDSKFKEANPKIKTRIVPEGVGNEYFAIKKNKPEFILFLGRFDMGQKGIDLLLHSYAKVQSQINFPLVLAGKGPDEEKIRQLIKELNLDSKVKIVGPAYGKKKFDLLSKALFVAFPSRHEGFSLFVLEAMAAALLLVSFDIPSLKWLPKDSIYKAPMFDVNEYSKLLLKAADKNKTISKGISLRRIARKYTWEKVVTDYEDFLYDVKGGIS